MYRIALFGEVLADIFPNETILGGAPYNVTRHLRALQQHPMLISRVGRDSLQEKLFQELSKLHIDTSGIQFDDHKPSGQVTVNIQNNHHHFDIRADQAYDYIDLNAASKAIEHHQPDVIYFGTLALRHAVSKSTLSALLEKTNCTTFLDINLRAPWYNQATIEQALLAADIVKINDDELATIAALLKLKHKEPQAIAKHLIETFNIVTLYVTTGESGAWAYTQAHGTHQTKGHKLGEALVDTVGAGDAFSAVCLLGHLSDWPIEKTLEKANRLAADVCQFRGAAPEDNTCYDTCLAEANHT